MQFVKRVLIGLGIFFVLMVAAGFVGGVIEAATGFDRATTAGTGVFVALGAGIWYVVKPRKSPPPAANQL